MGAFSAGVMDRQRKRVFLCNDVSERCPDYFADLLRLAKYRPAARIMIAHPPMVKMVVPMPPVEGRLLIVVFRMS